jgi:WD40 repeat protein
VTESAQPLRDSLDLLPRSVRSFKREVEDVLLSRDGRYFITQEDDFVRVWDTASLTQISDGIRLNDGKATFNNDRTLMVLVGKNQAMSVWELPKGECRWTIDRVDNFSPADTYKIPALRLSPDGKYIAASITTNRLGDADRSVSKVVVWRAESGDPIAEVEYQGKLYGIALNPVADTLALSVTRARRDGEEAAENENAVQFWTIKHPATLLFESKPTKDNKPLYSLVFSPDGKLLAAASGNRSSILEVGGGREFTPIEGIKNNYDRSEFIYQLSFSPDGKSVGAMRQGIDVDTWDVLSGNKLWGGYYNNEGWAYERLYVLTLEGGGLRVIDVRTGRDVARVFSDGSTAYGADYSPEADLLVVRFEGQVMLYDTGSAQEAARLTYSGDGKIAGRSRDQRYVALSDGPRLIIWDVPGAREVARLEQGGEIDTVVFSHDGALLASLSEDNCLRILETGTGRELWRATNIEHPMLGQYGDNLQTFLKLGFSPRSGFLTLEVSDGDEGSVRLYSLSSRREVLSLTEVKPFSSLHKSRVSFTPDERYFLLREPHADRVFETGSGRPVATFSRGEETGHLVLGMDNTHLARSLQDAIEVTEIASGRKAYQVKLAGVSDFAFSPDGKLLAAVGGSGEGHLWNAATGSPVKPLRFDKRVTAIEFSPDGTYLVLLAREPNTAPARILGVWELAGGREVAPSLREAGEYRIIFSPDRRHAVAGGRSTRILDLIAGREVAQLPGGSGGVHTLALSADGRFLARGEGREAQVWEMVTGREVASLLHEGDVSSVAFASNGRWLATASDDLTGRVWIIRENDLIERVCASLKLTLGSWEWKQYSSVCSDLPQVDRR